MALDPITILTGVGRLYLAEVNTAFPAVDAAPGASWTDLGETQDGVTITVGQAINEITVDQETGPVKAVRTETSLTIETKLVVATLENMAKVFGVTVTDTPPGAAIGTREIPLYRLGGVYEYAFLFRGEAQSPYGVGVFPAQWELPRGYFAEDMGIAYAKGDNVQIPVMVHALVDTDADDEDKFGRLVVQDAAAAP